MPCGMMLRLTPAACSVQINCTAMLSSLHHHETGGYVMYGFQVLQQPLQRPQLPQVRNSHTCVK